MYNIKIRLDVNIRVYVQKKTSDIFFCVVLSIELSERKYMFVYVYMRIICVNLRIHTDVHDTVVIFMNIISGRRIRNTW